MKNLLKSKIPDRKEVAAVLGVAIFLVYTWTMYVSFWKLPSWLLFLDFREIFSIYAYAFLVNIGESVLLLLATVAVSILLPRRWWKEVFVPKGSMLILIILLSAQLHMYLYRTPDTNVIFLQGQAAWWIYTFLIGAILLWVVGRVSFLHKALTELSDRFIVFLYIYLPLTAVAMIVILVRIFL